MPIKYRTSQSGPLSHDDMDANFRYINSTKAETTGNSGAVLIPNDYSTTAGVVGAIRFNPQLNLYQHYNQNVWNNIVERGYKGSIGVGATSIGATGYHGSIGLTGYNGSAGPTGYEGSAGYRGSGGDVGRNGLDNLVVGPTGPAGLAGITGPTGPAGSAGPAGDDYLVLPTTYLEANSNNNANLYYCDSNASFPALSTTNYGVSVSTANSLYISYSSASYFRKNECPLLLNSNAGSRAISFTGTVLGGSTPTELAYVYSSSNNVSIQSGSGTNDLTYSSLEDSNTHFISSDYRLKENITESTSGILEKINKVKIYNYNKIWDDDDKICFGAIAHEFQEIFPEFVIGNKDDMNEKGEPLYQSIGYTRCVPYIAAALKELTTEVEALESLINS